MMLRINRFLAQCGLGSRRKCDELITAKRVALNGELIGDFGVKVNPETDQVSVDGKIVKPIIEKKYVLLNKPSGYLTTVTDDRGRKTVLDLIPEKVQLFPVGRLDLDTQGVLLLTNDGELAFRLIHPKFKIQKQYLACLNKPILNSDLKQLQKGVVLEEGITAPCQIQGLKNKREVRLILHEGRKRQVKRMFQVLGYHVTRLERIEFAGLTVKDLSPGQSRNLSVAEVDRLRILTELTTLS